MKPPRLYARFAATRYLINPIARAMIVMNITPNFLTVTGLIITISSAPLIAGEHLVLGGLVMLGGSLLDVFDGAVARLSHKATPLGAFLDSVSDRIGEVAILFGMLAFYVRTDNDMGVYLVFGTLAVSLLVSYQRARAEGLGIPGDVGVMGRPERIIILGLGLLTPFLIIALWVVLTLSLITLIHRTLHVAKNTPSR
jgi:CDP-diacylglycerol--glycerol-3-phosphate 3-phosphatidyltransferase